MTMADAIKALTSRVELPGVVMGLATGRPKTKEGTPDMSKDAWFRVQVACLGDSFDVYVEEQEYTKLSEGQQVLARGRLGHDFRGQCCVLDATFDEMKAA